MAFVRKQSIFRTLSTRVCGMTQLQWTKANAQKEVHESRQQQLTDSSSPISPSTSAMSAILDAQPPAGTINPAAFSRPMDSTTRTNGIGFPLFGKIFHLYTDKALI